MAPPAGKGPLSGGFNPNSYMRNTFDVATISSFSKPVPINKVVSSGTDRIILKNNELNRILGGGLVPGKI